MEAQHKMNLLHLIFFLRKPKPKYLHLYPHINIFFFVTIASFLALFILYYGLSVRKNAEFQPVSGDVCAGKRIKVIELPRKFNYGLLDRCETISMKRNMCVYMENHGFGPRIFSDERVGFGFDGANGSLTSFYDTDQFSLELIFHNGINKYRCLTNESSLADAVYVPFYAGLEASRTLRLRNRTERDRVGNEVMQFVSSLPEWKVYEGKDHFFVAGRIGKDFIRPVNSSYWGNSFMSRQESKHVTMLTIESASLNLNRMISIPYPTYFHPSSIDEIRQWQRDVVKRKRKNLFAFAGASRRGVSLRDKVIAQCKDSSQHCKFLSCENGQNKECQSPLKVMKLFLNSKFCLQPQGDSPTRRSTFDSILSGCIPVFFSLVSGPEQYTWYFPEKYTEYSVFINQEDVKGRKVEIAEILLAIPESEVEAMRLKVVEMIPRVIYRDRSGVEAAEEEEDAFDIAVRGVLKRVAENKRGVSD